MSRKAFLIIVVFNLFFPAEVMAQREWTYSGYGKSTGKKSDEQSVESKPASKQGRRRRRYDAYDDELNGIQRGRKTLLDQKKRLEVIEKTEEEKEEAIQEVMKEARKSLFEQRVVQGTAVSQNLSALEVQLERQRFRRERMTQASAQIDAPVKFRKRFNLRLKETYDDNIFLDANDAMDDLITTVAPGATFSMSSKYAIIDASYSVEVVRYKENEEQNGTNHLLMTYIRPGSLALPYFQRRGGKIGIEIQDQFQPLVTSVASSEQTSRTERTTNVFTLAVDYYMSKKRR